MRADLKAGVAALAIAAAIWTVANQPAPVSDHQVPYCVIEYPVAVKDAQGVWQHGYGSGFGPCSLQDIYREI